MRLYFLLFMGLWLAFHAQATEEDDVNAAFALRKPALQSYLSLYSDPRTEPQTDALPGFPRETISFASSGFSLDRSLVEDLRSHPEYQSLDPVPFPQLLPQGTHSWFGGGWKPAPSFLSISSEETHTAQTQGAGALMRTRYIDLYHVNTGAHILVGPVQSDLFIVTVNVAPQQSSFHS